MTKQQFISAIEAIETQIRHDVKCGAAFRVILPKTYIGLYNNDALYKALMAVLKDATNDTGDWIEHFVYELDCGKKYTPKSASRADGSPIDLSNAGALWKFLQKPAWGK